MDVADLLAPEPRFGLIIWLLFGAAAIMAGIIALAVHEYRYRPKNRQRTLIIAAAVPGIICAGFWMHTLDTRTDHESKEQNAFEVAVFDRYGISSEDFPGRMPSWNQIEDSGSTGVLATVDRDGDESTVKFSLDGDLLRLSGAGDVELPLAANP